MPRYQMLLAVAQTICLAAIGWVISHHLLNKVYDHASQHHLWKDFMDVMEGIENSTSMGALNETISASNSTSNSTSDDFSLYESNEKFYWETLPRDLFFLAVVAPIYYYWHIWLERTFPARPRPVIMPSRSEKENFLDETDSVTQEEEVIQKWIAQGKIRRASLSWWNTFVKWILNLIVGDLWMQGLRTLLKDLIKWRLPRYYLSNMKWDALLVAVGSFFGIRPLSSLVGFIIIPAHQRVVFEAGAQAVWEIFCSTFLGVFLPWFADTEFASWVVGNMTEGAMRAKNDSMAGRPQLGHLPTLPDEL